MRREAAAPCRRGSWALPEPAAVHEATCTRVQRAGEDSTSRRERGEKGQELGLGGEFEASDGRAHRKPTRLPMKRRYALKSPEPRPRHRAPGGRYLQSWRDSRRPSVTVLPCQMRSRSGAPTLPREKRTTN